VYKGLRHVHIEALRIAEKDINAGRMLSMMGADDLEVHTFSQSRTSFKSDDFCSRKYRYICIRPFLSCVKWDLITSHTPVRKYCLICFTVSLTKCLDFRMRLRQSNFSPNQMSMLQLRLDLLDSFLRGRGGDISLFFKPGRLVIVDLSDPFIDCEAHLHFCSY